MDVAAGGQPAAQWERGRWAGVAQAVLLIPFMVTISIVVTLILYAENSESFL